MARRKAKPSPVDLINSEIDRCLAEASGLKLGGQIRLAAELFEAATRSMFASAQIFALARRRFPTAEFSAACGAVGFPTSTAVRLVKMHERYQSLPSARALLAHLGLGKLEVLAQLGDEEIESISQGREVNGIDLTRVEQASIRQLELDLFEGSSTAENEANAWKRRYERAMGEMRDLMEESEGVEKDFQLRCAAAIASIVEGVTQLMKLSEQARKDAEGERKLEGSVDLLSKNMREAGKLIQHRFGRAKNRLAKLTSEKVQ